MKRAPIRCTACGWTKIVLLHKVAEEILYHRDITCANKLPVADRPHRYAWQKPSKRAQRLTGRPRKVFCPTCRDEATWVQDALSCPSGCMNEARVR